VLVVTFKLTLVVAEFISSIINVPEFTVILVSLILVI